MIPAKDRYAILMNAIARSGGLDDIDLAGELAKSLSAINGFNAQQQMAAMQNPVVAPSQPPQGTITPEAVQTPMQPTEGQGELNLPPQM